MDGDLVSGLQATEAYFKSIASDYQIVHLATHGIIDPLDPENSELLFAPSKDSINDGHLKLSEIYNLRLNSDMVVLSACETGVGKFQRGEGSMSLSRAFFYSGVPSVVMSRWALADESTSKVITGFFKNILDGHEKDLALRDAQLSYLKSDLNDLKTHPFFWSALVVMGSNRFYKC